ncbi:hypothetical protein ACP4OV_025132 [Aristida adscensionis]
MDILVSAAISELISRSAAFLINKCWRRQPGDEKNLQRLSQLLLRAHAIVEEAEGRRITNQAMLLQLKMLAEAFYRGLFVLDTFRIQALPGSKGDELKEEEEQEVSQEEQEVSPSAAPGKRARSSDGDVSTVRFGVSSRSATELQEMADYLKNLIADTREFVVFLGSYPRLRRQPYCTYLLLDSCMFGRQMERERVLSFLLQPDATAGAENLAVLPIVGPIRVGKSTLVENVSRDEMVRDRFSLILLFRESSITDGGLTDLTKSGVVKHENSHVSYRRLLIVIELAEDIDEETWGKMIDSANRIAGATRIIITSRSSKIVRLGTTGALWLYHLPPEAYWHFFKTLAFGSSNPDEHPALASMAMEIATEQRQCFVSGYIVAELLRENLDARFWRAVLRCVRAYKQKHLLLFEEHPSNLLRVDEPVYYWRLGRGGGGSYFLIRDYYQTESGREEAGEVITVREVLLGGDTPRGRFEALGWRSRLPPYYNYVISCVMQEPERVVSRCRRKRRIHD